MHSIQLCEYAYVHDYTLPSCTEQSYQTLVSASKKPPEAKPLENYVDALTVAQTDPVVLFALANSAQTGRSQG